MSDSQMQSNNENDEFGFIIAFVCNIIYLIISLHNLILSHGCV